MPVHRVIALLLLPLLLPGCLHLSASGRSPERPEEPADREPFVTVYEGEILGLTDQDDGRIYLSADLELVPGEVQWAVVQRQTLAICWDAVGDWELEEFLDALLVLVDAETGTRMAQENLAGRLHPDLLDPFDPAGLDRVAVGRLLEPRRGDIPEWGLRTRCVD